MFDLINFPAQTPYCGVELVDVKALARREFGAEADMHAARTLVKRTRYLHYKDYPADEGLIKLMAQYGATLVVAVSDFLNVPYDQMQFRLARARLLVSLALHHGTKVRVCTLARTPDELRTTHELEAFARFLGMDATQISEMKNAEHPKRQADPSSRDSQLRALPGGRGGGAKEDEDA